MPAYATVRSGRWDDANPATNPWGVAAFPVAGDTVTINATHQVDVNAISGDEACASFTSIAATSILHIEGGAKLTTTGTAAWAGELEMRGSGNIADPTELVVGGAWTLAATAIWDVVGTTGWSTPDIKITGNVTGTFNFISRQTISGTITQCEFNTFGINVGVFNALNMYNGCPLSISNIKFKSMARVAFNGGTAYLTGTIYCDGHTAGTAAGFATTMIFAGTATILIENSTASTNATFTTCTFYDTITININEAAGTGLINACWFYGDTTLTILDVASNTTLGSASSLLSLLGSSKANLTTTTNARLFFTIASIQTDGAVAITGADGLSIIATRNITVSNLTITVTTGTVVLTTTISKQEYWQAARNINFAIIGSTGITLNGTGLPQYEPVLYKYDLTNYLFAIQYDLTVGCPNYTALYGASTGWTAATKTLAAGGVLRIYSTGHTATGMDMAISDLSGFTLATTGTATINTAEYYISFDGGTLWSGALTLTQLRANSYTINGNSYTTDPTSDIQLRIVLTSTLGGTVTQVSVTGIEYDPVNLSSYNIRDDLTAVKGAGFVTGTHDLKSIHDDLYTVNNYTTALSGLSYRSGKVHAVCSGLFEANSKFFKVKYF